VLDIVGFFYQSGKNNMVFDLYEKFGFILNSSNGENTIWNIDISNYEKKNNLIEVKND
jgi:predicted enzyme involved in methoxymalonyl-ACP biosynthesis